MKGNGNLFRLTDCDTSMAECEYCSDNSLCSYSIRYMDESGFSASLYRDVLHIGTTQIIQLIGGITQEDLGSYEFEPYQVDGIIVSSLFFLGMDFVVKKFIGF